MSIRFRCSLSLAAILALTLTCGAASPAAAGSGTSSSSSPIFVIANQDSGPHVNTISVFTATGTAAAPTVTLQQEVDTGGKGIFGGFFGSSRINSVPSLSASCLYVTDAGSNDIATFTLQDQQPVGNFVASDTDDGSTNGISLTVGARYLYASYSDSNTIATFALQSGCGLTFLGDVSARGLQGGSVTGMAVHANILVVAYGDGSIQSFNVASGVPVSNNDQRNSTAFSSNSGPNGNMPSSVDITQDGHFAIFGDISASTVVEVSNISSGKLTATTGYTLGAGVNSGYARLSPDQTMLFIANSEGGTVTAAFFNKTTGKVSPGCISPTLIGFNGRPWLGGVATRDTTGTGNVLYVGEFGRQVEEHDVWSALGILKITSNGTSCTLTESSGSPVIIPVSGTLSIGAYPPRPF